MFLEILKDSIPLIALSIAAIYHTCSIIKLNRKDAQKDEMLRTLNNAMAALQQQADSQKSIQQDSKVQTEIRKRERRESILPRLNVSYIVESEVFRTRVSREGQNPIPTIRILVVDEKNLIFSQREFSFENVGIGRFVQISARLNGVEGPRDFKLLFEFDDCDKNKYKWEWHCSKQNQYIPKYYD